MGTWRQDELVDWPSVVTWLRLDSKDFVICDWLRLHYFGSECDCCSVDSSLLGTEHRTTFKPFRSRKLTFRKMTLNPSSLLLMPLFSWRKHVCNFIYWYRFHKLLKLNRKCLSRFREHCHVLFWYMFEMPIFLQLECSDSASIDPWYINFWISDMDKTRTSALELSSRA
jgi:hypothetical protein